MVPPATGDDVVEDVELVADDEELETDSIELRALATDAVDAVPEPPPQPDSSIPVAVSPSRPLTNFIDTPSGLGA